ncbi:nicotinate (nicotinamide) nucleotide adenylyltransferase [Campylobacter sp. RM15925]|uniref:nicotinate (nicotinamide) nucleotide adenylyltransferase n=1 Tax=Campylobacter sp. RM15925 TaxID=1705724 RepID=UPI0014738938|nr:nicotinate (nicotinamide) nucleotide adenylyltransferase [Campylobacter sp. RM15925]
MKLAFFGGSFDPPHLGHDTIVKSALKSLDIDKLIIMPTYISPFKNEFSAPPELRFKWISEIWGDLKGVEISKFEIDQNRPVPTIESVLHLYEIYDIKKFYLLIGADHLENLHKWHDIDRLKELVEFVIAQRDKIEIPKILHKMNMHVDISSSQIRADLAQEGLPEKIKDEVIKFYQGLKCKKESTK